MRIVDDVEDGEVGRHIGLRQRAERQQHEERLRQRRGAAERHEAQIAARRADERQRALNERDREREDQRKMTQFRNHALAA